MQTTQTKSLSDAIEWLRDRLFDLPRHAPTYADSQARRKAWVSLLRDYKAKWDKPKGWQYIRQHAEGADVELHVQAKDYYDVQSKSGHQYPDQTWVYL